ncbi:MAG: L-aspartate oxidase [Lachnospiraceae bacterium]|nr:L-aspartate oxidase [Lachnospiraceae bacterium]
MNPTTDIIIVGTGAAGLFCALNLPKTYKITMITKSDLESSDSFLAQGGICMLKDENDYDNYFEDTMKAGHYENNRDSVEIMIRTSPLIIDKLIHFGVDFQKDGDKLCFTKEGGHSDKRILFHKDITGREITGKLLERVKECDNISLLEYTSMVDIIENNGQCSGIIVRTSDGDVRTITADYTILACGGIGGLYTHSTNFPHLTGDAIAIAIKHNIELQNINYIQIHPTTLYSENPGRRFLISESVRGEGALLYNANMQRFTNELLPRDILTAKIREQMEKDNKPYVWLSMANIPENTIKNHFPNIYKHCLDNGFDVKKDCIPVVPAQHYFMGGIKTGLTSRTSMSRLYAIGETSCNGVHGANRLASNSLLESLVFAKRAADEIGNTYSKLKDIIIPDNLSEYNDKAATQYNYRQIVLNEIEKAERKNQK